MEHLNLFDLPGNPDINIAYRLLPKNPDPAFYRERVDRNIGWITEEEQNILKNSVIGVAGCGGMGAQLAEKFLRLGVGEIRIADIEVFDVSNINRQFAAGKSTIGQPKAFATARLLRDIADDNTLVVYPQGICRKTVRDFLRGCDIVCDEIEFWAIGARVLMHQKARELGVPVMNCNTVGFGTRLFFFTPQSSTMEELLGLTLDEAELLETAIKNRTASPQMILSVMEKVISGLIPERPEYSDSDFARTQSRISKEGKASIIATNPPLATGFLADRVLFYLLRNSLVRRNIVDTPEMPAYLYFDAATMESKVVRGRWW